MLAQIRNDVGIFLHIFPVTTFRMSAGLTNQSINEKTKLGINAARNKALKCKTLCAYIHSSAEF